MKKFEYEFSEKEQATLDEWIKEMQEKEKNSIKPAIGGAYTYCFTPTSVGTAVVVQHANGEEIDITDYGSW